MGTGGDASDPPMRATGGAEVPSGSDGADRPTEEHLPSGEASTQLAPEEVALLAAFDRLRPQGNLQWCFDDAMRRLDRPDHDSASGALPWPGLPDDFWERGRSARVGRRFMGEVTGALAELLAADARAAADAAVTSLHGDRFIAAWDALRFLATRVDALEDRLDPIGVAAADVDLDLPDTSAWTEQLAEWLGEGLVSRGPSRGGRGPRRPVGGDRRPDRPLGLRGRAPGRGGVGNPGWRRSAGRRLRHGRGR